jgi:hypothetical protein
MGVDNRSKEDCYAILNMLYNQVDILSDTTPLFLCTNKRSGEVLGVNYFDCAIVHGTEEIEHMENVSQVYYLDKQGMVAVNATLEKGESSRTTIIFNTKDGKEVLRYEGWELCDITDILLDNYILISMNTGMLFRTVIMDAKTHKVLKLISSNVDTTTISKDRIMLHWYEGERKIEFKSLILDRHDDTETIVEKWK